MRTRGLKILTWNLNRGKNAAGEDMSAETLKWLGSAGGLAFDVLCLQLAPSELAQQIAAARGLGCAFHATEGEGRDRVIMAVISGLRQDVVAVQVPEGRLAQAARIEIHEAHVEPPETQLFHTVEAFEEECDPNMPFLGRRRPAYLLNVHLDNTSEAVRLKQWQHLEAGPLPPGLALSVAEKETLEARNARYDIVCGDFNALRRADYPTEAWKELNAFVKAKGWEERSGQVHAAVTERGYSDAAIGPITSGGLVGKPESREPETTFRLADAHELRLDYVFLSTSENCPFTYTGDGTDYDATAIWRSRRSTVFPLATSNHKPLSVECVLELDFDPCDHLSPGSHLSL